MIKVYNGIDNLKAAPILREGRLGLITNHSGLTRSLRPSYEVLNENYTLVKLFSPEHGLFGAAQAGAKVEQTEYEPVTGLPVISLYGGATAPDAEQLDGIDALCFDIQDVGARFYTYLYTMTRSMKAAAEAKLPFVVFDRINPVGLTAVEGELLDEANASFVGEYSIPHRCGLTIGEFARYINKEKNINAELYVIPCRGLDRYSTFRDSDLCWAAPSPNMPTPETALVYSGTCIFEAVKNVSEGRGTTQPFECVGAPFIDEYDLEKRLNHIGLPGVIFRRVRFVPTFSKFSGECCRGAMLHVTDKTAFSPFESGLYLLNTLREAYDIELTESGSKRLFGTSRLYDNVPTEEIIASDRDECRKFRASTEKYFLY